MDKDQKELLKTLGSTVEGLTKTLEGFKKEDKEIDTSKLEGEISDISKKIEEFDTELTKKDELIKTLEGDKSELEKTVKKQKEELDEVHVEKAKIAHEGLVKDALALYAKMDTQTEVKDEASLVKSITDDFDKEELEKDLDKCIKEDMKVNEKLLKKAPEGQFPLNGGDSFNGGKGNKTVEGLRKKLDMHGIVGDD